jgi:naphthoate synthase
VRERASCELSSEFVWGAYTQTCPSCGAKGIPESFHFCGACGAALERAEVAVPS